MHATHTAVTVSDLEATTDFYEGVLGLEYQREFTGDDGVVNYYVGTDDGASSSSSSTRTPTGPSTRRVSTTSRSRSRTSTRPSSGSSRRAGAMSTWNRRRSTRRTGERRSSTIRTATSSSSFSRSNSRGFLLAVTQRLHLAVTQRLHLAVTQRLPLRRHTASPPTSLPRRSRYPRAPSRSGPPARGSDWECDPRPDHNSNDSDRSCCTRDHR